MSKQKLIYYDPQRRCPGPQQHGHSDVYESHCDHGKNEAHEIEPQPQRSTTEFQDAAYYLTGAREGEQPPATDDKQEWAPLSLAQHFHNLYERAAPEFGYETRIETRAFDPESSNGKLMIAVCSEILRDFNAALAAERETGIAVSQALGECEKELATEREKTKLQAKLRDEALLREVKLIQQLTQAQAAIAKHNKCAEKSTSQFPIEIDLSALDKHDEEVRKPLVDALKLIREARDMGIYDARKIATDVLEKVKEQ